MLKLVSLYRKPREPQEWMGHFMNVHRPLLESLPSVERIELSSPLDGMSMPGAQPDRRGAPFLMVELYFTDRGAFDAAMVSDQGRAMIEDVQAWAGGEVTTFLAEVQSR
jgi:uncharacterized protein (TIGR02118 family)